MIVQAKRKFQYWFLLLSCISITLQSACSDDDVTELPGLSGSWILSDMEETSADGMHVSIPVNCADIVFSEEKESTHNDMLGGYKMQGWMPINSYQGYYQAATGAIAIQQGDLNFADLITTEMAGSTSDMEFEQYYLSSLRQVKKFQVKGDVLTLSNADGSIKIVYVRGASSCGRGIVD